MTSQAGISDRGWEQKYNLKNYLPGYHPMGDLNDDSNSGTWPVYFGDKASSNRFHEQYSQRIIAETYVGYHNDTVKQKILEHEAIFKTQLYELHRLYRVQRDLMDELKMIELEKKSMATETAMSSCSASQKQDAERQQTSSAFWLYGSGSSKKLHSTPNLLTGQSLQNGVVSSSNAESTKDCEVEILDCMPPTARRKYNLEMQADKYISVEEPTYHSNKAPCNSRYRTNGHFNNPASTGTKMYFGGSIENDSRRNVATLNKGQSVLADLNEKIWPQDNRLRSAMEWSQTLDSARSKGETTNYSQNLLSENVNMYIKCQDATFSQTDRIKAEYWKEISEIVPKHSVDGIDYFNRLSNLHQLDKSFSTSNGPWEKTGSCLSRKSATSEMNPCYYSSSTLLQILQSSSKVTYRNEFYKDHYLASEPARCSTAGSQFFNCSNGSLVASGRSFCQNGLLNLNGLSSVNENSVKGIDLNVVSIGDDHDSDDRKDGEGMSELRRLKSSEGVTIKAQINGSGSSAQTIGVPVFRESHLFEGASSCHSSFLKEEEVEKNGRIRGFDMNLSCESEKKEAETVTIIGRNIIDLNVCLMEEEDVGLTTSVPVTQYVKRTIRSFDLEAPSEIDEDDLIQLKRQRPGISDEDTVNVAAEAIVGILSFRKLTLTQTPAINSLETSQNTLKWFVDEIISLHPDDEADKVLYNKSGDDIEETDSFDYFEYMTLQLPETKKDDYLPDYPEPSKPDEPTGAGLFTTRTRKGQARRGRPRRDFHRDILPGLTSLARHEVTEDMQIFGGLMRAMGHSWPSGITRARPRRGRPRLTPLQSHNPAPSPPPQKKTTATTNNELINIKDHKSLTGWGKTTRRPRRQRCPTGNVSVLHVA